MIGKVKWFNYIKGYGFIIYEEDKEVFFHVSCVKDEMWLNTGDKVNFDLQSTSKGPMAKNVILIE